MPQIVAISDTHTFLHKMKIPDGDILIHAGDATFRGTIAEISKFNEDLGKLPHPTKIFIPGNHDWLFERDEKLAREMMTNAAVLIDQEITVAGVRIYGSPWQPEFCSWAFNLDRGHGLQAKWNLIPDGIDVLVTHGPPYGKLDLCPDGSKVGCWDLLDAVCRVKPKYHIFGHIHHSYGRESSVRGTEFINASNCNEAYNPKNPPIVFKI